jgi:phosphomannomutase/phosphoglucomutase
MNPNIFREYDIRGRVPDELNQETVYRLGLAFGTYFKKHGASRIALGRDCRLSSPELSEVLLKSLMDSSIHVVEVGMVPTPLLYFSLFHLEVDGGVPLYMVKRYKRSGKSENRVSSIWEKERWKRPISSARILIT